MPVSRRLPLLPVIRKITPIRASTGVKEVGLSSCTKRLPLSMPVRLKIQAVTVVPTLAPMITLMAWRSVINPELTKPTTITVVAEEDWITAVTAMPVKNPAALPEVSRPAYFSIPRQPGVPARCPSGPYQRGTGSSRRSASKYQKGPNFILLSEICSCAFVQISCCSLIISLNCRPSASAALRHSSIRPIKISK